NGQSRGLIILWFWVRIPVGPPASFLNLTSPARAHRILLMSSGLTYQQNSDAQPLIVNEQAIEDAFLQKLGDLKYAYRPDIRDRAALERNFREKFEALNRVRLTDAEFARLLDDLVSPDVFKNSVRLREKNNFIRD